VNSMPRRRRASTTSSGDEVFRSMPYSIWTNSVWAIGLSWPKAKAANAKMKSDIRAERITKKDAGQRANVGFYRRSGAHDGGARDGQKSRAERRSLSASPPEEFSQTKRG